MKQVLRVAIGRALLACAARRWSLALLNGVYRFLGQPAQAWMQPRYAKMFRDGQHRLADGQWRIGFAGHDVIFPMRSACAWLDWDIALSALGHEPDIKQTYRTMLTSKVRPDLFVDIGGNYGTHSLLFLACGVDTITFEPNSSCHAYFREACRLNGVQPRLEHAALGAERGQLDLYFPERETWLGSLDARVIENLKSRPGVRTERVDVRMLDEFEPLLRDRRLLIKIDAEGHEVAVLTGAQTILRQHRPLVLFEAHQGHGRAELRDLLGRLDYRIAAIPLGADASIRVLGADDYLWCRTDDFLAIPAERLSSRTLRHTWRAGIAGVDEETELHSAWLAETPAHPE